MCSYQKIRLTCIYLSSYMFTFMKCKKMLAGGTFDRKDREMWKGVWNFPFHCIHLNFIHIFLFIFSKLSLLTIWRVGPFFSLYNLISKKL